MRLNALPVGLSSCLMACPPGRLRPLLALAAGFLVVMLGLTACSRDDGTVEAAQVKTAFAACRTAILSRHADEALKYLPEDVDDYFKILNAGQVPAPPVQTAFGSAEVPGVNLLLRTALDEKVTPDLRSHLTLQTLLQRVADHGLLDTRNIRDLSLGRVDVRGQRATAELFCQGKPVPLRLPFVKEDQVWKIDLLAILPYAEVLMRLDRAVTGRTQNQEVAQLVNSLPTL
jgi:hypothetical protein